MDGIPIFDEVPAAVDDVAPDARGSGLQATIDDLELAWHAHVEVEDVSHAVDDADEGARPRIILALNRVAVAILDEVEAGAIVCIRRQEVEDGAVWLGEREAVRVVLETIPHPGLRHPAAARPEECGLEAAFVDQDPFVIVGVGVGAIVESEVLIEGVGPAVPDRPAVGQTRVVRADEAKIETTAARYREIRDAVVEVSRDDADRIAPADL